VPLSTLKSVIPVRCTLAYLLLPCHPHVGWNPGHGCCCRCCYCCYCCCCCCREIAVTGHDLPSLLYKYLDELLFVYSTEYVMMKTISISQLDTEGFNVTATGWVRQMQRVCRLCVVQSGSAAGCCGPGNPQVLGEKILCSPAVVSHMSHMSACKQRSAVQWCHLWGCPVLLV
jgi:hypothetical protein